MIVAENADAGPRAAGIERSTASAPPSVRRAIDRNRRAAGLPPLAAPVADPPSRYGPGVWWDASSPRMPAALAAGRRGPPGLVAAPPPGASRVLCVVAFGDATARDVGRDTPERIRRDAFGPADQLGPGWLLRSGHGGPALAVAGPQLRAHDTEVGLVVEWLPDPQSVTHREILARLDRGPVAASVKLRVLEDAVVAIPEPTRVVRAARLVHVALLGEDERPAYPGAVAVLFRDRPAGAAELRRQLAAVVAEARWRAARAGRP